MNNIYGFSGYGFLTPDQRMAFSTADVDKWLDGLQIIFIEGKFYSIFSLLFGIGFSMMMGKGTPIGLFYRRLGILFLFGAAHILLLWEGDILLLYALLGFALPLFRNTSDRTLLICSAALILSPILVDVLKVYFQGTPGNFFQNLGQNIDATNGLDDSNWRTYLFNEDSSWTKWRGWMESGWAYRFFMFLDSNRILKVFGLFLLGLYIGRKKMYMKPEEFQPLLKKVALVGFCVGVPFNVAIVYFETDEYVVYKSIYGIADTISYAFGVVPLALAYAAGIALWYVRNPAILRMFAPAGRMALTTYLSQTVIGILLFYGFFGGLGQRFGLAVIFPIALLIYAIQIAVSAHWLKRFQYGPLEWLWRQLTYGKRLPLIKKEVG